SAGAGGPAFVLRGEVPAYRDISPGAVGDDVRQLQEALVRLGFKPGRTDGVYDDRTGLAVAAWYLKGGWAPSGPSDEQLQALRSAQADWFTAESDLITAQADLTAARNDYEIAKQRAAAAAREELTAAEDALAAASDRGGSGGSGTDAASHTPPDQQAVLDAATAQAEARKAADAVAFAQKKVGLAARRTNSGPTGTKLGIQ